jgi:hypothetical protein
MSRKATLLSLGIFVLVTGLASLFGTGAIGRPTPLPRAATPAILDLSGTWAGQYAGPINSSFSLTWTQTADALDGTIILSSPPEVLHITGDLTGRKISFGAGDRFTYTGTLSGSTMAGSYTDIADGNRGSWTATLFP